MPAPKRILAEHGLERKTSRKAPRRQVIYCYRRDLCKEALQLMVKERLMSLPVYTDAETKTLAGVVDMIDMVALILKLHGQTSGFPPALRYMHEWHEWREATVQEAMHETKRKAAVVEHSGTFQSAARLMVDTHAHRVLVRNSDDELVGVITQSDVVNALYERVDAIDQQYLNRPISSFHHVKGDADAPTVLKVERNKMAIEAFLLINQFSVSAVPVVDAADNDKLVGSISARDVRTLADDDDFPKVLYTHSAYDFCKKIHLRKDTSAPLAAALHPRHTMHDVINLLHKYKIHRVWVTNDEQQVTHVLSLCDVLEEMIDY